MSVQLYLPPLSYPPTLDTHRSWMARSSFEDAFGHDHSSGFPGLGRYLIRKSIWIPANSDLG